MDEINEAVKEFLIESREGLDRLDRELVDLEKDPKAKPVLTNIFRTVHTLKGASGFLGFSKLEEVAHAGENLLVSLREGKLVATPPVIDALLAMTDAIREMIGLIETKGNEGARDYAGVANAINLLQSGGASGVSAAGAAATAAAEEEQAGTIAETSIRVDVDILDRLMNLVGELVLTRNQILQYIQNQRDAVMVATSSRLDLITTGLQEGVMKTRMQPIGVIWAKFQRIARDLAAGLKKHVQIEEEGRDTELDKSIIEAIKDPLVHIVRNAIDHGLESPEERKAAGKPAEGVIRMRAYHEGGQVNIEISDDGRGIDYQRVKAKAIEQGLVTAEKAAGLGERELLNFIFMPGFSTAEKVSHVSGRGVGMDVVKASIDKIGGTVDVQTKPGQGTTIKMKIPLTLAIIPALMVNSKDEIYAIPQVNLLEMVRLEGETAKKGVEMFDDAPVYRLRDKLIPLVYLNKEFGYPDWDKLQKTAGSTVEVLYVVVLQAEDRQFGLVVDDVQDTIEIVVKPLAQQLKGIPLFAGATITGDGRVALILDVLGLAQRAKVVSEIQNRERMLAEQKAMEEAASHTDERIDLLLLGSRDGGRMVVPLSAVERLEVFEQGQFEWAGALEMSQYRGRILPVIRVGELLPERRLKGRVEKDGRRERADGQNKKEYVVIYTEGKRSVGLVVDQILDIVREGLSVRQVASRDHVRFTVVVQGRVSEVLDVDSMIKTVCPKFFEQTEAKAG